jgi:multidrug efflux pump subunit AcrB
VRVEVGAGADGARLDLTLAGDDPRQLETTAALLETQLRTLRDIGAVISGAALATPEIQITPDPAQAAAHGVTTEAMAGVIRVATSGDYAANLAKLNLPGRQLPIRVRLAPALRENLDALAQLRVPAAAATAATGANATAATNTNTNTATAAAAAPAAVALGDIARIEIGAGPAMITRLDRARNHTLSIELAGRTLGEVAAEALRLPALQNLPPGITRVEQGEMEDMTEMFGSFGFAMLVGLFCIYAVLVLLFHDFLQPLTILMAIPLALGGALLPLVLTGGSFSMPALIGLLMLTGIVTKNSILLVDYIIKAREKGLPRPAALHEACRHRVRPILMTTLAMTGGMLPTVLGLAGGDPSFRQPMALVVVGGLTTSTLLSLVVIPVAYTLLDDATAWAARLSRRRTAR